MSINPPRSSRAATEDRYREIRTAALRRAEGLAAAALAPTPVRLDDISAAALQAFHDHWEGHPARRYPWPWPTMLDNAGGMSRTGSRSQCGAATRYAAWA